MSGLTQPRGPLPSRVYWTRRVLVLLVVLALLWGVGRLLGGKATGESAGSASDTAAPVRAVPKAPTSPTGSLLSTTDPGPPTAAATPRRVRSSSGENTRPATPEGTCADSDVLVTPLVKEAHVGQPIEIVLLLSTVEAEACLWEVHPDSVVLRITQTGDPVWSSQHCPGLIPVEEVVPRRTKADRVVVPWDGTLSAPGCTAPAGWAYPGEYAVAAVARGAVTPVETEFTLEKAVPATVTASPTPTGKEKAARAGTQPAEEPATGPSGDPTGDPAEETTDDPGTR